MMIVHNAHVPNLWSHLTTGCMYIVYNMLPASKCFSSMEMRNVAVIGRGWTTNHRALRKNQSRLTFCAPSVVSGYICSRYSVWREGTRHRSHHNSIFYI